MPDPSDNVSLLSSSSAETLVENDLDSAHAGAPSVSNTQLEEAGFRRFYVGMLRPTLHKASFKTSYHSSHYGIGSLLQNLAKLQSLQYAEEESLQFQLFVYSAFCYWIVKSKVFTDSSLTAPAMGMTWNFAAENLALILG